jgi:hypothetical protein
LRIRGYSHQYQVVPPSIIFFPPSHVEGIFLFCVLPGSEVRPWPRVSHALRPKSDRLEAKQLRICLLSKRVVIPRQKSNSRGLPPKHRPAESSRWFSATGPCQVGVNRASSASFACIGASVPSSSLPSQRGISATARHSTAGVTECSLWRHETSQKLPELCFFSLTQIHFVHSRWALAWSPFPFAHSCYLPATTSSMCILLLLVIYDDTCM